MKEAILSRRAAGIVYIAALPLLIITASVAWSLNDLSLYYDGFDNHGVSLDSGIAPDELRRVGREFRDYFNSGDATLAVTAEVYGVERILFGAREVHHMADVKRRVWAVYGVGAAALLAIIAVVAGGWRRWGPAFLPTLSVWTLAGSLLTLGLITVVGLLALAAFDWLFVTFHRIVFTNDFWRLNPSRDYLVRLFPEGFWFDATLFTALLAIGLAAALASASGGYLLYRRRMAGAGGDS